MLRQKQVKTQWGHSLGPVGRASAFAAAFVVLAIYKYAPVAGVIILIATVMDGLKNNLPGQWLMLVIMVPGLAAWLARHWLAKGTKQ